MKRLTSGRGALALIAGLALSGCGTQMLDTAKVEEAVKSDIGKKIGARVDSAECPKEVEQKRGEDFDCTFADANGDRGKVTVVQTDDSGNVDVELLLDPAKVEEAIKTTIGPQVGTPLTSVECPGDIEQKQGANFDCSAVDAEGSRGAVGVTQTDDSGSVNFKLK